MERIWVINWEEEGSSLCIVITYDVRHHVMLLLLTLSSAKSLLKRPPRSSVPMKDHDPHQNKNRSKHNLVRSQIQGFR